MQTARLTGVEAETQLGYAGLHRFLLRFGDQLERLIGTSSTVGACRSPAAAASERSSPRVLATAA